MITIYQLKPKFQALLRPFVNGLAKRGVTANQVTLFALAISIAQGLYMAFVPESIVPFILLPVVMFVRMALNAVDGMLAREHHQQSKLGAILNEMSDVVSDTALYLPFIVIAGISQPAILAIVILAILTEMLGVVAIQIGASRRYDGPMGKSDRAFWFGAIAALLAYDIGLATYLNYLLYIMIALLVVTLWNRGNRALKESSKESNHAS